ncbi:cyanide hydratase/nitrilase-like protein [Dothidotthia symphoricarpi CBS 119687]|uniref:nitrilase n=1 Tax=Dothidotthia symphoricarpi CBS 119687 TaxID=1392245 RepID=A0A6A6AE27_9PLEO|nr:cyanide hydratase/nitrilase-like protein [Dothidotthia symphoricarpi CBS 119687]KAF2129157.1 cyanide hydratase/nitrilase-like protein [Dothidotthia symphoricarpi CBS 119687]
MSNTVKVAVTQHEPVWFDLDATVDKTCRLIEEAAENGAKLVVFPEVWVAGYPAWIWARPLDPPLATSYIKNSLSYDSPQMRKICATARSAKTAVVLGFSENDHNSLYISQCTIAPTGDIVMKRRKFKPTHMERTVFGDAGGASLNNVVEVQGVGRVGALSCWEHIQPLLKYHTMSLREQIHVAAWPPLHAFSEGSEGLYSMTADGCAALSQTYAMESSTFVLHCTAVMTGLGIAAHRTENTFFGVEGGGRSAVYGPDGRRLTEAIAPEKEGFVYAELPMDMLVSMRHFADPIGHYSRPELLWLGVDAREKKHVRVEGDEKVEAVGV